MGYRYCPRCGEWLRTDEYTVDGMGETICSEHGVATHGFMLHTPWSEREFYSEIGSWYDDRDEMLEAAKESGLVV